MSYYVYDIKPQYADISEVVPGLQAPREATSSTQTPINSSLALGSVLNWLHPFWHGVQYESEPTEHGIRYCLPIGADSAEATAILVAEAKCASFLAVIVPAIEPAAADIR